MSQLILQTKVCKNNQSKQAGLDLAQRNTEGPERPSLMLEEVQLETAREKYKSKTQRFSDKLLHADAELKTNKRIKLEKVKCAKLALRESESLLRQVSNQEELFGNSLKNLVKATSALVDDSDRIPNEMSKIEIKIKDLLRSLEK